MTQPVDPYAYCAERAPLYRVVRGNGFLSVNTPATDPPSVASALVAATALSDIVALATPDTP